MRFKINQIVPVISNKNVKVDALRVIKELVETSLDSDTRTTYVFERLDGTKIDSETLERDYEIFGSINDLRKSMVRNATTSIDKLVGTLTNHIEKKWPKPQTGPVPPSESDHPEAISCDRCGEIHRTSVPCPPKEQI